ncbi:sugar transferase [bacterium]|nr:sugar transferase [bacterium]
MVKIKKDPILLLFYTIIIISSFYLGHYFAYGWIENLFDIYTGATVFTFSIYLLSLLSINERNPFSLEFLIRLVFSIGTAGLFSSAISYYLPLWRFNPRALVYLSFIILFFVYVFRVILYRFTTKSIENVMIIGSGKAAKIIGDCIEKYNLLYKLKGYIDYEKSHYEDLDPKYIYRDIDNIEETLKKNDVNLIILAQELEQDDLLLQYVVNMKLKGYKVVYMADIYESLTGKVPIKFINNNWFINSDFYSIYSKFFQNIKRIIDIIGSIIGLILTSPIILITMLLIKLEDRGPIFFLQERVGLNGDIFKIIKFRSMKVGSEKGALYTAKGDSRITRIGNFIRKTRVDEIPQFINVLKGEMSIIGPRAEWIKLVNEYEKKIPYYKIRHLVKPGITGWAQVEFQYGASIDDAFEKLQYDLYYIKHNNLMLDIIIFIKTVGVMFFFKGR